MIKITLMHFDMISFKLIRSRLDLASLKLSKSFCASMKIEVLSLNLYAIAPEKSLLLSSLLFLLEFFDGLEISATLGSVIRLI